MSIWQRNVLLSWSSKVHHLVHKILSCDFLVSWFSSHVMFRILSLLDVVPPVYCTRFSFLACLLHSLPILPFLFRRVRMLKATVSFVMSVRQLVPELLTSERIIVKFGIRFLVMLRLCYLRLACS
jgi:hypothetical protein